MWRIGIGKVHSLGGIPTHFKNLTDTYSTKAKSVKQQLFENAREFRKRGEEKLFEPAKLHMVKRIRTTYGRPYWEKLLIRKMGLEDEGAVAIVKNTPNINKLLWEVKHLISVKPITFPNGLPKDYSGTFLKRNGELLVSEKLKVDPQKLLVDPVHEKCKIDGESMKRELARHWHT